MKVEYLSRQGRSGGWLQRPVTIESHTYQQHGLHDTCMIIHRVLESELAERVRIQCRTVQQDCPLSVAPETLRMRMSANQAGLSSRCRLHVYISVTSIPQSASWRPRQAGLSSDQPKSL